MKTRLIALAICGLLLPLNARAEEKKDEKKPAVFKEIDVKGLKIAPKENGNASKPTVINSAEELAKAIPDAEAQAKIKKDVDFTKQTILFFAWAGSGQDKFVASMTDEVVFNYEGGLTRDLRQHVHLFVLPKNASFKVVSKR